MIREDEEHRFETDPPPPPPVESDEESGAPVETGVRRRRAALQRKRRRTRILQIAAGIVLVTGVVVLGAMAAERRPEPEEEETVAGTVAAPPAVEDEAVTALLFGTREDAGPGRGAVWMLLLSYDPDEEKGSVVYIPAHTAVEVPGRGLQGVGEAYGSGDIPLLLVSTENLLGISIDRYIELSDKDARVLFDRLGSLEVDVPSDVSVTAGKNQTRVVLVDGLQDVDPSSMVTMLYLPGVEGDDVDLGSRHLAFWDALFEQFDPGEIGEIVDASASAVSESDADPDDHAKLFTSLASLPPERLTITSLPVRPISAGDSELYAVDAEELETFIETTVGTAEDAKEEVRVQILNGNGVPGIGQEVARQLVGEGFRVILSGNARRLNYRKTLVITYDETEQGEALAERAVELLGVGEVQISAQQQGIVDLTIVVGKDFVGAN